MIDEELRLSLRVPAFCPVCKHIMKGSISTTTYYDWGCCSNCHIEFVEGREKRWKDGWRPDDEMLASFDEKLD